MKPLRDALKPPVYGISKDVDVCATTNKLPDDEGGESPNPDHKESLADTTKQLTNGARSGIETIIVTKQDFVAALAPDLRESPPFELIVAQNTTSKIRSHADEREPLWIRLINLVVCVTNLINVKFAIPEQLL